MSERVRKRILNGARSTTPECHNSGDPQLIETAVVGAAVISRGHEAECEEDTGKPKILLACPRMRDRATPLRKSTRIGRDRKSASAPRRRKLAATQRSPMRKASVTDSDA
jgi:hypothetical protein